MRKVCAFTSYKHYLSLSNAKKKLIEKDNLKEKEITKTLNKMRFKEEKEFDTIAEFRYFLRKSIDISNLIKKQEFEEDFILSNNRIILNNSYYLNIDIICLYMSLKKIRLEAAMMNLIKMLNVRIANLEEHLYVMQLKKEEIEGKINRFKKSRNSKITKKDRYVYNLIADSILADLNNADLKVLSSSYLYSLITEKDRKKYEISRNSISYSIKKLKKTGFLEVKKTSLSERGKLIFIDLDTKEEIDAKKEEISNAAIQIEISLKSRKEITYKNIEHLVISLI